MSKKSNIKKLAGACAIIGVISLSTLITPKVVLAHETGASLSDIASYYSFENDLKKIWQEPNITFQNQELFNKLKEQAGGNLTIDFLKSVRNLIIEDPLNNSDLSDLKYLPNLNSIFINDMNINCHDLMYNQNLSTLDIAGGTIKNTQDLPNTIKDFRLDNTTIVGDIVYVPYNTTELALYNTTSTKIHVKNPKNLITFEFNGYALLDLEDIKDCVNLNTIKLTRCANVKNGFYLKTFANLHSIEIDEYACIWIDNQTLESLNLKDDTYLSYNKQIDEIIASIIKENMTEEERLNAIILYITDKIDYDQRVAEERKGHEQLSEDYNEYPLYFALNSEQGTCITYASLFSALANRIGLNNYQPRSEKHTWNMVRLESDTKYEAYDLGGLDGYAILKGEENEPYAVETPTSIYLENNDTDSLYYYGFNLDTIDNETFKTQIKPTLIKNFIQEIGYLKSNNFEAFQAQFLVLSIELMASLIIFSTIANKDEKEQDQQTVILKYKRIPKKSEI